MPTDVATTTQEPTTEVDATHATMKVTFADGTSETYHMDRVPPKESTLVQAAKQEILIDLDLNEMIADLSRVSELLYLAYCGVAGTHIQATIADRHQAFLDLCGDCVSAMESFELTGHAIANEVADAFFRLTKGQEKTAIKTLERSAKRAATMAVTAQGLADRAKALGDEVQKDHHDTLELSAKEQDELAALRKAREKMQAEFDKQTKMNSELAASVAQLQALYEDAKSREEKAEERAFISGIVSGVTSAMGAAVGAYAASRNPLGAAAAGLSRRDDAEEAAPRGGGAAAARTRPSDDSEIKSNDDDTADEDGTSKDKPTDEDAGDGDGAAKTKPKKKPKEDDAGDEEGGAKPESDKPKDEGAGDEDDDSKSKPKPGKKKPKTDPDNTAGLAGAGAGLQNLGDTTKKMANDQAAAGESVRQEKMRLLNQKLAQEAQKREVAANLAELTSKLSSSDAEKKIHESASVALQIAVWAFANIVATLMITKHFWDNVKKACDRLASNDIESKIKDEIGSGDDIEARKQYYLGDRFMPAAIANLARWAALADLGADYKDGSVKARDTTELNFRSSPTIEKAHELLEPLKDKISGEIEKDKKASHARTDKVKAQMLLLTSSN